MYTRVFVFFVLVAFFVAVCFSLCVYWWCNQYFSFLFIVNYFELKKTYFTAQRAFILLQEELSPLSLTQAPNPAQPSPNSSRGGRLPGTRPRPGEKEASLRKFKSASQETCGVSLSPQVDSKESALGMKSAVLFLQVDLLEDIYTFLYGCINVLYVHIVICKYIYIYCKYILV